MTASSDNPAILHRPDTVVFAAHVALSPEIRAQARQIEVAMLPYEGVARLVREQAENGDVAIMAADVMAARAYLKRLGYLPRTQRMKNLPVDLAGLSFSATPWSAYGAGARLDHRKLKLHIHPTGVGRGNAPNVYVELGQLALWEGDWKETLQFALDFVKKLGVVEDMYLSRCDLAVHNQILTLEDLDPKKFKGSPRSACIHSHGKVSQDFGGMVDKVEREIAKTEDLDQVRSIVRQHLYRYGKALESANYSKVWYDSFRPQMISFGGRGGRTVHTRIYNKSREVTYGPEKKAFFRQLWNQAGFDHEKPVINIEFELCREAMRSREFSVDGHTFLLETPQDLLENYHHILAWCLGEYIQMCKPNEGDSNRARWPIDPRWTMIRDALDVYVQVQASRRLDGKFATDAKTLHTKATRVAVEYLMRAGRNPEELNHDPNLAYRIIEKILDEQSRNCELHRKKSYKCFVNQITADLMAS